MIRRRGITESRLSKLLLVVQTLVLASAMALLSVFVQRTGPELVQYGNLCGPTFDDPCYRPVLKGGFPFAYLFDAPGVSRENQLAFVEDNLSPGAFALNIVAYVVALLLGRLLVSRWRAAVTPGANRGDA